MIKVYVACEFGRMEEARVLRDDLGRAGFDVVSTWMIQDEKYDPVNRSRAMRDYLQVKACDVLVSIPGKSVNANCEIGLALGLNKVIICIADRGCSGNIFILIPSVTWVDWCNLIPYMKREYGLC